MEINEIKSGLPLFSMSNVLSDFIANQLNSLRWDDIPQEPDIISNRYRLILPKSLDRQMHLYLENILFPLVEQQLKIKFVDIRNFSVIYWICTPGYLSGVHIDGTLPGTLQIFWEPTDRIDYGTCFYNSQNTKDILHYFPNIQNTGYLALAKKSDQPLWHGTIRPVGKDVLRIAFMIVLGDYECL